MTASPTPPSCSSVASCKREEEEQDEEESIFSSLGEESRFVEEAGTGSGEGGSCSVPGSIREDESRVSVSEVLVGVSASWWSGLGSLQDGTTEEEQEEEEEEEEATQREDEGSAPRSSSLLTLRRLTGVTSSSSAQTHKQRCSDMSLSYRESGRQSEKIIKHSNANTEANTEKLKQYFLDVSCVMNL